MDKDVAYLKAHVKAEEFEEKLKLYQEGKPLQYIIGNVNFCGHIIKVNEHVLIPRFETELLVDKTINYINKLFNKKTDILDMGTGSGCIAISMKKAVDVNVDAADISLAAIEVAKENALLNNVDINFIISDIFVNINHKYDVIISNPPYIGYDEVIMDIVKNNEPHLALYAPNNGLFFYEEILKYGVDYLNEKYMIALEIGSTQGEQVVNIAKTYYPDADILIEKDLAGKNRYVFIIKN